MKKVIIILLFSIILFNLSVNAAGIYTVKSGDSLWKISNSNGISIAKLKEYNSLTSDMIYVGQILTLSPADKYTVKSGDSLWLISQRFGSSVDKIKSHNNLSSDIIYINQILYIPKALKPAPVLNWPSITYIVKEGDYLSVVAKKFNVSQSDLLKYNYMDEGEWLNAGQKIAINGYAPRNYDVIPNESTVSLRTGKLVDWFLDGRYLIKRNDVFLITDVYTGMKFNVKMLGGYNHADVEPVSVNDTLIMQKLFPTWTWNTRPVVIFHKGINFAASISGMPHSQDSIKENNVSGHFDLYLLNSIGHGSTVSSSYEQSHKNSVLNAAGLK